VGAHRWPMLAAAALVGFVAIAGLAGRLSINASKSSAKLSDSVKAMSDARRAHWLMPWAAEPWQALGAAQLGAGQRAEAVASYRHALAQSPTDYRLWVALARAETGPARWHDFAVAMQLNPQGKDDIRLIAQQLLNPNPGATS